MDTFRKDSQTTNFSSSLSAQEIEQLVEEGNKYYYGKDNHPLDKEKAIRYYEKAAANGHAFAQLMSAYMYDFGDGISANPLKAIKLYSAAAKQGDPNATLNLANIYLLGRGIPKNIEEGIYWIQEAANLGNAVAESSLGRQYTLGEGVEKSLEKAEYWITKAEESGYINCETMMNLGLMYEKKGNLEKAFICFEKALDADPGNCDIQYLYGQYLFFGKGTTKDVAEAKLHIEWVVEQDPSDQKAYELLTQIQLYEQISAALDVINAAISNQCYIWDYHLQVIAYEWGYCTVVWFCNSKQNPFENSEYWENFSSIFSLHTEDCSSYDEEVEYKSFLKHSATVKINLENLEYTINCIEKDFDIESFRRTDNYFSLTWRK